MRWWRIPEAQSRLQLVIDDPAKWQKFSNALDAERQFGQTRNAVTQGSRTTPLALDVAEMAGGPNPGSVGNDIRQAGNGPLSFAWGKLLQGGVDQYNQRILGIRGNVADQLGNLFMAGSAPGAQGGQDLNAAFNLLRRRQAVQGCPLLARYLTPGTAGGMVTNTLDAAVTACPAAGGSATAHNGGMKLLAAVLRQKVIAGALWTCSAAASPRS